MSYRVLAYTWNLSGSDTSMGRKKWTKSSSGQEWQQFLRKELASNLQPPSIVILALQEWDTSNQFHKAFGDWLSEISKRKYVRVTHQLRSRVASVVTKYRFSQLLNIYYLPKNIVSRVKPIGVTCFGKKILGKNLCDKGSLGVNVTVLGKSMVFVASHFPFDKDHPYVNNHRNAAFNQTMKAMKLEEFQDFQNSPVVWLGDLNYRMAAHGKKNTLKDDLQFQRNQNQRLFGGFLEGPRPPLGRPYMTPAELPTFYPTCKMIKGKPGKKFEISWDKLRKARNLGKQEAYDKTRTPSYCDRILARSTMRNLLSIQSYKSSGQGTNLSDHNAVCSNITIQWNMPQTPKARGQYLRNRFAALRAEKRFQIESVSRTDQTTAAAAADILIETEIHNF